ncbi:MAG: hypothetical protein IPK83_12265 [Planctomycetes bacterium]|nr:hypothetical protein [Planctomycetota bacterium]
MNPDRIESNFSVAEKSDLDGAFAEDMPFEYIANVDVLTQQAAGSRTEFWWPLLIGAVAVLMLEQGLAWWFGARVS